MPTLREDQSQTHLHSRKAVGDPRFPLLILTESFFPKHPHLCKFRPQGCRPRRLSLLADRVGARRVTGACWRTGTY